VRTLAVVVPLVVGIGGCGRIGFAPPFDASGSGDAGDASGGPADGFFVEVPVSDARLSGLAGAATRCLAELSSNPWRGKAQALAQGQVDAQHVRAWLCTTSTCQDLMPGRVYTYASRINPTRGGATFVATPGGFLDDDNVAYETDSVFGVDAGFQEYFTGRGQDNQPQTATCGDWTSATGSTNVAVSDTPDYGERLSKYSGQCSDSRAMICIVDPL
jgi:hypothetical protein